MQLRNLIILSTFAFTSTVFAIPSIETFKEHLHINRLNPNVKHAFCSVTEHLKTGEDISLCSTDDKRQIGVFEFSLSKDRDLLLSSEKYYSELIIQAANRRVLAKLNKRPNDSRREDFMLEHKYITENLEKRTKGSGFLVIEITERGNVLTGFMLFDDLLTPEGLELGEAKSDVVNFNSLQPEKGIGYPKVCEIVILLGLGTGKALINLLRSELEKKREYSYLIANALESATSFYKHLGFSPVKAQSKENSNFMGMKIPSEAKEQTSQPIQTPQISEPDSIDSQVTDTIYTHTNTETNELPQIIEIPNIQNNSIDITNRLNHNNNSLPQITEIYDPIQIVEMQQYPMNNHDDATQITEALQDTESSDMNNSIQIVEMQYPQHSNNYDNTIQIVEINTSNKSQTQTPETTIKTYHRPNIHSNNEEKTKKYSQPTSNKKRKRKTKTFPQYIVNTLKKHIQTTPNAPHPEKCEIAYLALETNLTEKQVRCWFTNYRSKKRKRRTKQEPTPQQKVVYEFCDYCRFQHLKALSEDQFYIVSKLNKENKKHTNRFSYKQLKPLLKFIKSDLYPTKEQKLHLSKLSGLTVTQVSSWFTNYRARNKKKEKSL